MSYIDNMGIWCIESYVLMFHKNKEEFLLFDRRLLHEMVYGLFCSLKPGFLVFSTRFGVRYKQFQDLGFVGTLLESS